jgi:hypothetical protein
MEIIGEGFKYLPLPASNSLASEIIIKLHNRSIKLNDMYRKPSENEACIIPENGFYKNTCSLNIIVENI